MARLPYDTDRLQGDDRGYDQRDWRSSPRVSTNRDLDRLVDEISLIAANKICDDARKSVFQTFHFNMMSRQDFLNEDFRGLVQFICDSIEWLYSANGIRRYDDDLRKNVENCVAMHCAKQMHTYEELLDECYRHDGDRVARVFQANAEKFLDIVDQIERLHSEDQRDVRTGGRDDRSRDPRDRRDDRRDYRSDRSRDDRDYDRDRSDRRSVLTGRDYGDSRDSYRRDDRRYSRREEEVTTGREAGAHHEVSRDGPRHTEDMFVPLGRDGQPAKNDQQASTGYRPSSSFFQNDAPVSDSMNARSVSYAPATAPAPAPSRSVAQVFQYTPTEPSEPPPPPPAGSRQEDHLWDLHSPKAAAPAGTPAVDPNVYTTQAQPEQPEEVPSEVTTPIGTYKLVRFTNGESQMNATEHAAVYPVGSNTPAVDMSKEVERVMTLEKALTAPSVQREQIEDSTNVLESLNVFSSIGTLAAHVSEQATIRQIADSGENTDGVRRIYHSFGVVDNSVIGFKNLNTLQGVLRETGSLRDILAVLRRTMESVNTRAPAVAAFATDMRAAVRRFDRLISREINIFCREVLMISKGDVINSAISQYNALVEHIENDQTYGASERKAAFLVFVSRLNSSIHEAMAPELGVERNVIEANDLDCDVHGVAMLPMTYLVTHLPFTMEEMGLETQGTSVITEDKFSAFLKTALDVTGIEDDLVQTPLRLLVTRDLEVFRVFSFPGRQNSLILIPVDVL